MRAMRKILPFLLTLCMLLSLSGCGNTAAAPAAQESEPAAEAQAPAAPAEEPAAEEEDEENYETGDASLDDPLNADGIGETELLVVSFGTSFNDSRRLTIGAIERALQAAFPYVSVRRGFTAQIIIDHVARRDGEVIDNVTETLDRAVSNGVKTLVVQPTHLMNGLEYDELVGILAGYSDAFERVVVGEPLLTSDDDFARVAQALVDATAEYDDGETAICFMGHGTEAESNKIYAQMQEVLTGMGMANYFVGTVEAEPSLEDVLAMVDAGDYTRVVLRPMMVVAGDHANNDMAGDEEDSWKSAFEAAGYEVECVVEGLGGIPEIQELYVEHAKAAFGELDDDYFTGDASLDDPLNADGIGETELLVVSFGTSFNGNRVATIGAIEGALAEAFPEAGVRRGFTAQIIIDHILERDGEVIDNVTEALERAVANGVKTLVVQPTHLMNGFEYDELIGILAGYIDDFEAIQVGEPLLTSDDDFQRVAQAMVDATAAYDDGETAICFMGHGTEAKSNGVYAKMQTLLTDMGKTNYFIGTVEAEPSLEDVLALVQAGDYKRVVLRPMMVVAGDHANNDMAGDEEDSWKTAFEAAGYEVVCVIEGLGGIPEIQQLYVEHAQRAFYALDEDTGDAARDDPLNADGIGETELLVVSFGTSFNDNRVATIGGIENALKKAYPDYSVRRGFTAQIIIDHVRIRDGEIIDNVTEALERAVANEVKTLIVQPTHLMNGIEYDEIMGILAGYSDAFDKIIVGAPLLTSDDDFQRVAQVLVDATAEYDDGETAICFMGHGTEHESNGVYARMQQLFTDMGKTNYFVGTVEAEPSLEDVMALVQAGNYKRVVLRPMMVVAGDHANNDMAGDEEGSWKTEFEAAGYEVIPVIEGLGGIPEIQQLYIEHVQAAIDAAA